jgi:type I restriction enzyme S subunit
MELLEYADRWDAHRLGSLFQEQKEKNTDFTRRNALKFTYGSIVDKPEYDMTPSLIDTYSKYKLVNAGDIIINCLNLNYDFVSQRVAIVKNDGIITSAYISLRARNDEINPMYYCYYFKAMDSRKMFHGMGTGIRLTLSYNELRNVPIPVPPRAEQDQIVRFLDWKISKANALINIKKKEIKSVESLKHSAVSDAVTHGLTADIPMKYSGVKWLGDIPAHWTTIKLRQLLSSVSEKNHPELPLLSVVREQGVIVRDVDDKEVNHNYIPDDLSGYKMVKKGQFVMNKMKAWQGSYGISDYTGIVSPAYFIFDVAFDNLEYFHYAIRSKVYVNFFAQASDGIRVGQWDLQMDKMKEIPFIVPPADEQIAIVEHIKKTLPKYDEAIEKIKAEVAVLEEYKAKLIDDIVTGKIDVRNVTVPEYEHVDDIVDDDSENNEETETDGEEA